MPWDTGKDVTVNDLMFLFNLENDNADGISHGFDMNTEKKQLEEVVGTDDETSIKDLHHFTMLVNSTMNAIPFNTETEMELWIVLGKFASELNFMILTVCVGIHLAERSAFMAASALLATIRFECPDAAPINVDMLKDLSAPTFTPPPYKVNIVPRAK
ncbi:hypothetical protein DM01DRAFT_325928 [Hesseltinella vesiculosa]|uniref:Uncharacterized protein n=1 Tax=Hesseltinella vesiculosa TaxID=101127 RepID=A0A1X2G559_9FUNG|nr:hypothetical protein DM01DRAFT_325928 [Hesseltinella vesiculosa]